MNTIRRGTWALVADGARARLFRLGPRAGEIEEFRGFSSADSSKPSRELVSDGSSRSRHVAGLPGSHSKQPRVDAHDLAERRFAESVMKKMGQAASRGDYEGLVIVADPRTLGRFRRCMPRQVATRVSRELDAEMTWMPEDRIDQKIRAACALR